MRQRVEISAAEGQDAAELAALAKQCFPDPWSEGIFRQTLCCCYNRIWCARQNGTLCGYVAVSHTGNAVNLDDIAVHPDFRRQGIGRQLWTLRTGSFRRRNSGWRCGSPTLRQLRSTSPRAMRRRASGSGTTTIRRRALC